MYSIKISQNTDFWFEDEMENMKCVIGVNTNPYLGAFWHFRTRNLNKLNVYFKSWKTTQKWTIPTEKRNWETKGTWSINFQGFFFFLNLLSVLKKAALAQKRTFFYCKAAVFLLIFKICILYTSNMLLWHSFWPFTELLFK